MTIPVIGTGRAGLCDVTFEDVVHETVFSFATKSQDGFVSRKMTICIYPPALLEANVTWERSCNYLDLQCQYFTESEKSMKNSEIIGYPLIKLNMEFIILFKAIKQVLSMTIIK